MSPGDRTAVVALPRASWCRQTQPAGGPAPRPGLPEPRACAEQLWRRALLCPEAHGAAGGHCGSEPHSMALLWTGGPPGSQTTGRLPRCLHPGPLLQHESASTGFREEIKAMEEKTKRAGGKGIPWTSTRGENLPESAAVPPSS